jgi:coenzyme F420-reducing hydrogenase alpha subunit
VGAADADRPAGTAPAHAGPLACGALALAPGEGIAWTEMSRGLLMHWVRLEEGARQPDTARVALYRVLAPTEWNFHPRGALGLALAAGRLDAAAARLAALALDPCIRFDVAEPSHA